MTPAERRALVRDVMKRWELGDYVRVHLGLEEAIDRAYAAGLRAAEQECFAVEGDDTARGALECIHRIRALLERKEPTP